MNLCLEVALYFIIFIIIIIIPHKGIFFQYTILLQNSCILLILIKVDNSYDEHWQKKFITSSIYALRNI